MYILWTSLYLYERESGDWTVRIHIQFICIQTHTWAQFARLFECKRTAQHNGSGCASVLTVLSNMMEIILSLAVTSTHMHAYTHTHLVNTQLHISSANTLNINYKHSLSLSFPFSLALIVHSECVTLVSFVKDVWKSTRILLLRETYIYCTAFAQNIMHSMQFMHKMVWWPPHAFLHRHRHSIDMNERANKLTNKQTNKHSSKHTNAFDARTFIQQRSSCSHFSFDAFFSSLHFRC